MKNSMREITKDDVIGHWKSLDGRCYLVIDERNSKIQFFVDCNLYIDEPLCFEYMQVENHCRISTSIILWMIFPDVGNVIMKINEDMVEFTRS